MSWVGFGDQTSKGKGINSGYWMNFFRKFLALFLNFFKSFISM
jgi:hypothetical protein